MSEWISVDIAMPSKKIGRIIFLEKCGWIQVGKYKRFKNGKDIFIGDKWRVQTDQISHWMLLPDKPK